MTDMADPPEWTDNDILDGMSRSRAPVAELPVYELSDYIASFTPPDYLIDRILITGRVYSLTAGTGHLKTAWATYAALCVACGSPMAGLESRKGRALYLSGENDEDQKSRVIANMQEFGFKPDEGYFNVLSGSQGIGSLTQRIRDIDEAHGPFALIVIDTSIAYFGGDDENSNTEQQAHAGFFREFTRLPGSPTVLILCHPTKNPTKDNLIPRGGGAFLNAVDGNLTLWKSGDVASLHHQGKFRGAPFEPISLSVKPVILAHYNDSKGRPIESVVVQPMSEQDVVRAFHAEITDENKLLYEMLHQPQGSFADWAESIGWTDKNGNPLKSKVSRLMIDLAADKLTVQERKKWILTTAGRKIALGIE